MSFSNLLSAADLNDFISPSQACIKPPEVLVESKKKREITQGSDGDLQVGKEGDDEPSTSTTTTISLADCLACSGCITSAESVLITQQSHTQVYEALKGVEQGAGPVQLVLSISPQARASFAAKLSFSRNKNIPGHQQDYLQYQDLDETRIHRKLDFFFKHVLNTSSPYQYVNNSALPTTTTNTTTTKYVVDTSYSRDLSLIETAREFVAKYKAASYSSGSSSQDQQQLLPLLTSACPGWICYAEKTHPHIIPYISTVKSPQQIMGSLVKHYLTSTSSVSTSTTTTSTTTTTSPPPLIKNNSNNNNIYHVSVMPCYDKKLEASRQDFIDDVTRSKDVDCVITTGEVELMLKEHGISSLDLLPDGDVDEM